jgi:glycosyltransferase involved in cell wall biosynthesis
MRIWIVTQARLTRPGGIATHVRLLQQGLQFDGHEAHALSMDGLPVPLSRLVVSLPLRAINFCRSGAGIRYAVGTYARLLRRYAAARVSDAGPPDVFACQDLASVAAVRPIRDCLSPGSRILLTVHSQYTYEKVGQGWIRPGSAGEQRVLDLERSGMLAADSLVAVSQRMRSHIGSLIGQSVRPVTVLHNAIDVDRFAPPVSARQRARCRRQFGLPAEIPIALVAGHLQEIKGVHVAVEAAGLLRDQGAEFLMALVGNGPMRQRLEAMIQRDRLQDVVRLMPAEPHDRMPALYRAADVLLMPSIPSYRAEESFGLSAIEAMSCGLPVVASRTGGLAETVRDGENGLLVTPGDPAELADAAGAVLADPELRAELGLQGRDFVVAHHDHIAHGHRFAEAAQAALGGGSSAAVVRMAA